MKRIIASALLVLSLASLAVAGNVNGSATNPEKFGTGSYAIDIDLARYKGVSIQGVYSDGTPSAITQLDGIKGTAALTILSTSSLASQTIQIGTITFVLGTDISTGPSSGNTTVIVATTVAAALRANTGLNTLLYFSTGIVSAQSVVTATAAVPSSYAPFLNASSTNTLWNKSYLFGGVDSTISTSDDIFTKASHGLATGERVWVSTVSGSTPTGLTWGTTYFAIRLSGDSYALATTSTTAVAGTKVDITAQTGSGNIDVNPLALTFVAGTSDNTGFKWQASNDGTNYADLSISSVTYSSASNTIWDLGAANYRWLRLKVTGPSAGALSISTQMNGKD